MTSNRLSHLGPRKLLGALLATTTMFSAIGAGVAAQPYAQEGAVQDVVADTSGYGGQLALAMGGSRILRFTRPIGQVMVGNPKVGDVIPLGERTLYVLGKATGATSLTVMPRGGGAPLATLDLRVGYDVANIRRAMREVLPGETLDVSARGDGVVLTGVLASSAAAARAASLAEQYAPGHVVNLTSIRGAEQVMLSVRVAEVQRTALQQLGLNNLNALWDTTGALTLPASVLNSDAVVNLIGHSTSGDWTFQGLFDALERKGFASTLAEPNLVALSGETAVFFAGGEFPIPVPQTGAGVNNSITIEYKQYGVSIGFTPTVFGDTINLAVAPEVSALDPANSIVLQGFRIPGITTRRAKTTIELRNGQSFAIAGLIKREFSDNLRGIPGASRMPVFGALFRSTGYQNNETEVVIIVTAHLAKPTDRQNLIVPTDVRQGPSEADLYMSGATDRAGPPQRPSASLAAPPAQTQRGATGPETVASSAAIAAAPAPKPVAATPVQPLRVSAPPAAAAPTPSPTIALSRQAIRPSAPATTVASSAPAAKPLPASQAVATPKPVAAPAPTISTTASTVRPATPVTVVALSTPAARPAPTPQAATAPKSVPNAASKAPPAAQSVKPAAADQVAAATPAPVAKLVLAATTSKPTLTLALTPTSSAAAAPAVGR